MTMTYTGYALPPNRAIFKRRNATAAVFARSVVASVLMLSGLTPALADDAKKPANNFPLTFTADGDTRLQFESTKVDGSTVKETLFDESNFNGHANWSDWLTINATATYENSRFQDTDDFYPEKNTALQNESLTLRQLYAELRPFDADLAVFAGKFHAHFGSAWGDAMPGIFNNFGLDYEQEERDGGGIEWGLPDSVAPVLGNARLYVETFFLDNGPLSESYLDRPSDGASFIGRPASLKLSDGGASNTGNFNSATVALQGHKLLAIKGTTYQLSYTHEGVRLTGDRTPAGEVPEKAEDGVSAGFSYKKSITADVAVIPFVEYTHFNNFDGQNNLSADYYLFAVATTLGEKWEVDVTAGFRHNHDGINATDSLDTQQNIAVQYKIIEPLQVGVGFNHINANRSDNPAVVQYRGSNTIGISLNYDFTLL